MITARPKYKEGERLATSTLTNDCELEVELIERLELHVQSPNYGREVSYLWFVKIISPDMVRAGLYPEPILRYEHEMTSLV